MNANIISVCNIKNCLVTCMMQNRITRAQLISRMENVKFHGGFWQKMPDFTEISRTAICCSLNPQNHLHALIHKAYLRYLEAINVKMSPMAILLFIDMLTG